MREQIQEQIKKKIEGSALIYNNNNNTTATPNKRLITLTTENLVVLFKIIRIYKKMRLFKCFIFYPQFINFRLIIMKLVVRFLNSSKIEYRVN